MIKRYIKKPVIIEAVQWTGHNFDEIQDFVEHGNVKFVRETNPPAICIITNHRALYLMAGGYVVKSSYNGFDTYTKNDFEWTFKEATE